MVSCIETIIARYTVDRRSAGSWIVNDHLISNASTKQPKPIHGTDYVSRLETRHDTRAVLWSHGKDKHAWTSDDARRGARGRADGMRAFRLCLRCTPAKWSVHRRLAAPLSVAVFRGVTHRQSRRKSAGSAISHRRGRASANWLQTANPSGTGCLSSFERQQSFANMYYLFALFAPDRPDLSSIDSLDWRPIVQGTVGLLIRCLAIYLRRYATKYVSTVFYYVDVEKYWNMLPIRN